MHQNLKSCPITVALLMPAKTKLDEKRLLVFPVIFPTGLFAVMHSKIGIFHLKYRLDIGYAHIIHYFSLEKVSTQLKDELWGKREVGGFLHLANNCKNYFGYKCWLTQFKESYENTPRADIFLKEKWEIPPKDSKTHKKT